ncbi:hypothetical protein V1477_020190 [Vespula maculifrons]|uniref:Uncharacterized protein n=1 Tax=Vespula maculifrons TaxID=7453 RepID=A0ABD2AP05_VESMC
MKRKEKMNSTEVRVRKSSWIFRRNFGDVLQNAAIRSAILAHHKILMKHKYFRPRSHRVEVAAVGDPRSDGVSTLKFATFIRAREHQVCARRHRRECSFYPTRVPRGYIEIREEEEQKKRKRRKGKEKKARKCAHMKRMEQKRKERKEYPYDAMKRMHVWKR